MRPNPQETVDLVTFTEDILDGKLYAVASQHPSFHGYLQDSELLKEYSSLWILTLQAVHLKSISPEITRFIFSF